jgi:hypothetical protein
MSEMPISDHVTIGWSFDIRAFMMWVALLIPERVAAESPGPAALKLPD